VSERQGRRLEIFLLTYFLNPKLIGYHYQRLSSVIASVISERGGGKRPVQTSGSISLICCSCAVVQKLLRRESWRKDSFVRNCVMPAQFRVMVFLIVTACAVKSRTKVTLGLPPPLPRIINAQMVSGC